MFATLSGAMMAATRAETMGPEARRPARRDAEACIPRPARRSAPMRLLRRIAGTSPAKGAAL